MLRTELWIESFMGPVYEDVGILINRTVVLYVGYCVDARKQKQKQLLLKGIRDSLFWGHLSDHGLGTQI